MTSTLNIPEKGNLDFLSFGALNHRVDSGTIPFNKAHTWTVHPSGGEYNVAANLANCFRLRTGIASAMVDSPPAHPSMAHPWPDGTPYAGPGLALDEGAL
jgi:2-dehydro-3-deoxygluconokinase